MLGSFVYAESNVSHEEEQQVEIDALELDVEEEEEEPEIKFSFEQASVQTIVDQPITVTFFSNKKTSDISFTLPNEASLAIEQLAAGTSVEQIDSHNWRMCTESEQNTFALPVVFHTSGNYVLTVGNDANMAIVVQEKESPDETIVDEMDDSKETDVPSELTDEQEKMTEEEFLTDITAENILERSSSTQFVNPLFSYSITDSSILGWGLFIAPLAIDHKISLNISPVLNDELLRYAFQADVGVSDRILFKKDSYEEGLQGKIRGDTALIVYQTVQTTSGKKYLVRERYTGEARHNIIMYKGTANSGSGAITPIEVEPNIKHVLFTASESNYTASIRVFSDGSQNYSNFSIDDVDIGERVDLEIEYLDVHGNKIHNDDQFYGMKGEEYQVDALDIPGYILKSSGGTRQGILEEDETITFQYFKEDVALVDPLDPDQEVNPENQPALPEEQGLLSLDFISSFHFGTQKISVTDQTYYAKTQRLLNEDGTTNQSEERPNYIQLSDRRSDDSRNGWQLSVTQKEQFAGENGQELMGARISLKNQQVITSQGGQTPILQAVSSELTPGNKRLLLSSEGSEGWGTWVYRFGDATTAGESIALEVPKGANPEATTYSTTFVWELGAVPGN